MSQSEFIKQFGQVEKALDGLRKKGWRVNRAELSIEDEGPPTFAVSLSYEPMTAHSIL